MSAPGLGVWQQSAPGVQIYRYVRQVTNLPAPGRYRAAISYRWLDAHHRIVRQAVRTTPVCVQPDERPLLVVGALTITPSPSSLNAQYAIALRNDGRGPAGPIDVALTVNGTPQPQLVVQSLGAGHAHRAPRRRAALHAGQLGDGHGRPAGDDQRGSGRRPAQDRGLPAARRPAVQHRLTQRSSGQRAPAR